MFPKILIANRGEIACRIIKSAQSMNIKTVAIYSEADKNSLHVKLADEAYCVGGAKTKDSYLQIENIIKVAKNSNAQAIHPGYGFLSESPEFAARCAAENITFIGPSITAMQAMASKQIAKQLLEKTTVPLTPGYHGAEQSSAKLLQEAKKIGFPILLKAANGGGGRGMRIVTNNQDFHAALNSAKREAMASFGDDTMLIEKLITAPRHIEVQILADKHGKTLHLFERDCSIQRRHQKIIEEAPASALSAKLRNEITSAAVKVAKAINYYGAGTVEFLSDGNNFYFMEMNTRLQVEHPVTEMITGIDLVAWQIRIAANQTLNIEQQDIKIVGHAIECRVYAEDPENDYLPDTGKIKFLQQDTTDKHVRIDSGINADSEISSFYDPMLAKIIAWGQNREQARTRLVSTLANYHLIGVKNNINFLKNILQNQDFITNKISTNFLAEHKINPQKPDLIQAAFLGASLDYLNNQQHMDNLSIDTLAFQMHLNSHWTLQYIINTKPIQVKIVPNSTNALQLEIITPDPEILENSNYPTKIALNATIDKQNQHLIIDDGHSIQKFLYKKIDRQTLIFTANGISEISRDNGNNHGNEKGTHANKQLTAPMPGTIIAILKNTNEQIQSGEPLIIMEAMKMEHTITAPHNGTINSIFYEVGAQVPAGATLIAMDEV